MFKVSPKENAATQQNLHDSDSLCVCFKSHTLIPVQCRGLLQTGASWRVLLLPVYFIYLSPSQSIRLSTHSDCRLFLSGRISTEPLYVVATNKNKTSDLKQMSTSNKQSIKRCYFYSSALFCLFYPKFMLCPLFKAICHLCYIIKTESIDAADIPGPPPSVASTYIHSIVCKLIWVCIIGL